ncbi:MAG TPA: DUF1465 family protein [Stellaceae bacterium]|jgi:regulator of CtrA degradation|nr:DUF1465 family protein [Stellaceae bacterium]
MEIATAATANTTYFSKTFDETMDLLVEARNYVAADTSRPYTPKQIDEQLTICCETFRLTSRLTHVMAWLLAQRAVHEGELTTADAASETYQLGGRKTCLERNDAVSDVCDRHLSKLLDRSLRLYTRIARLDDMVRRNIDQRLEIDRGKTVIH